MVDNDVPRLQSKGLGGPEARDGVHPCPSRKGTAKGSTFTKASETARLIVSVRPSSWIIRVPVTVLYDIGTCSLQQANRQVDS